MADLLKELLTKDSDTEASRKAAREVGAILKAKTVRNQKVVLGESYCPYKIPMHTPDFWCFVFVSDASFGFTAECRRKISTVGDFCVNLVTQSQGGLTGHLPSLSKLVGVEVYGHRLFTEDEIAARFLTKRVMAILRKIDFSPICEFLLSPIQFHVQSSWQGCSSCAEQTRIFRDLITTVYEEACERNKSAPG